MERICLTILFIFSALSWTGVGSCSESVNTVSLPPALKRRVDFRTDVYPILKRSCFACHQGAQADSGYRLDVRAELLGKTNGQPLVTLGDSKRSRLIQLVARLEPKNAMPPDGEGEPLTAGEVGVLRAWVDQGLEWDDDLLPTEGGETHWSFQPVVRPTLPVVTRSAWPRNSIDYFVLRRLESEGLPPSEEADRRTLIRRVSLDLIGLPPTPAEVDDFVSDRRPDAYDRVVDRLLASPLYGERWARPWLDLCHYADSDGYLTDQLRPYAWRYRHWLVEALNRDQPFDEFTVEQIAGDLLHRATLEQKTATGFLRQTLSNREGGADPEEFRVEKVVDRTATVSTVWLGLTVGCARCHNHKFDPLTTREFYELYAFLDTASEINIDAPRPGELELYLKAKPQYDRQRRELLAPVEDEIAKLQSRWEKKILRARAEPGKDHVWDRQWEVLGLVWGGGLGEGQLEGWEIAILDPADRTPLQREQLRDYFIRFGSIIDQKRFKKLKVDEIVKKLQKLNANLPKLARSQTMHHTTIPRQSFIHIRGDFRAQGPIVSPNTPHVLPPIKLGTHEPDRLSFARWLVSHSNPLTPRVTVNRMWQEFFGRGLVLSSDDFGTQGERPSHPKLLDWLASEFMEQDWSVKTLHRLLVTSATYRQSSKARPNITVRDPDNRLLARQSSLRLSAEGIRDVALFSSGLLHAKIGGPSVYPPQPESVSKEGYENKWPTSKGKNRYRRGLYTWIQRTSPFAQNATFDGADPSSSCTRRERSNTPLQSLTLLNDPVFFEAAQALAAKLLTSGATNTPDRLNRAFELCLARSPTDEESTRLLDYITRQREILKQDRALAAELCGARLEKLADVDPVELGAWVGLSSVVLNLHEFITRD